MDRNHKEHVELINRQMKELVGVYRDAIKRLDVSDSEFWIWYTLVSSDVEYTQQDICAIWTLPKQTVNTIITHMRLKKYAYLEAIPGTRNHKVIRLTEAGKAYGKNLIMPITQAEEKTFMKISPEEMTQVTNIIGKYLEIIKDVFKETEAQERGFARITRKRILKK